MADSDFPLFVANARLLKAFDSVGLHVGIALANKAATSNKYKEVVKSLISQSVDTDETIQSAEWYVDEDKFENAYLREYMIGTSDAANEWGSCKNHCKLHQEPCKVHVCIHVSLLHNMQDIEDLDPLSFKVKGSDSQDPLAWLEFLSGSQLAHAFLVCVILLHELAHLLHYQSCVWLRTKIEMYFDELGQHIFPLANAQSPSCPHSGPTTFDSTLQCTAPKYMDGVLLTDLGEMVEQKLFGGRVPIEGMDGSAFKIKRLILPTLDGIHPVSLSAAYLQQLADETAQRVPVDSTIDLPRELAKAPDEKPRGLRGRTYRNLNEAWPTDVRFRL